MVQEVVYLSLHRKTVELLASSINSRVTAALGRAGQSQILDILKPAAENHRTVIAGCLKGTVVKNTCHLKKDSCVPRDCIM